jgi:hypothetical protein
MWMNEYDVQDAVQRWRGHPVLGPATETLKGLVDWTNSHSDGWAYWPKPGRAAVKLMDFIEGPDTTPRWDRERKDATEEAYRKALSPIKAFCTRHKADVTIVLPDLASR